MHSRLKMPKTFRLTCDLWGLGLQRGSAGRDVARSGTHTWANRPESPGRARDDVHRMCILHLFSPLYDPCSKVQCEWHTCTPTPQDFIKRWAKAISSELVSFLQIWPSEASTPLQIFIRLGHEMRHGQGEQHHTAPHWAQAQCHKRLTADRITRYSRRDLWCLFATQACAQRV